MGAISYGSWCAGSPTPTNSPPTILQPAEGAVAGQPTVLRGRTSRENRHRHKVTVDSTGQGRVEMEQAPLALVDRAKGGRQDRLPPRPRRRNAVGPRAHLRHAQFSRPHRPARRQGRQRGRRMDLPQLHRRAEPWAATFAFQDISEEAFTEESIPQWPARRNEHRVFSAPTKAIIEKGRAGQPERPKPQDRQEGGSAGLRRQGLTSSTCSPFPANCRRPRGRKSICSRTSWTTANWRSGCNAWRRSSILGPVPGRPVPPRRRRLLRDELRQGLCRNLAADGGGHRFGCDVQHVLERPGRHARHLGGACRRLLQRLHVPPGHRTNLRRRTVRVDHPAWSPNRT